MTLLARPEDLAAMRGVDYDPTDITMVLALEAASEAARGYCNQVFGLIVDEVVDLDGTGRYGLILPELPVYEVSMVEELDSSDVATEITDGWRLGTAGLLWNDACWSRGRANIRVTYSHGYVLPGATAPEHDTLTFLPLPPDLEFAVLQMASRHVVGVATAGRVVSSEDETVGSYRHAVTYADEDEGSSSGGLMAAERLVLDRYRSVRLA